MLKFKRLFCRHKYTLVRIIYGDEIISTGFKRSVCKCDKCGKIKLYDAISEH